MDPSYGDACYLTATKFDRLDVRPPGASSGVLVGVDLPSRADRQPGWADVTVDDVVAASDSYMAILYQD